MNNPEMKTKKLVYPAAWETALRNLAGEHGISAWIRDAMRAQAQKQGTTLPGEVRPHGVRTDALPAGWKSRLFRDMYQLVVYQNQSGMQVEHYHLYNGEFRPGFLIHKTNPPHPPAEVYIVDEPDNMQDVAVALANFFAQIAGDNNA